MFLEGTVDERARKGGILEWICPQMGFGPHPGVEIVLKPGLLCIGRGREGESRYGWLLIPDPTVSRHHANLHWLPEKQRFLYEHVSRTNPTLVNGNMATDSQPLIHGARLHIGLSIFDLERKVIKLPGLASLPSTEPVSDIPVHDEDYFLKALPDGYSVKLLRVGLNTIGPGVNVLWIPIQGRFVLNAIGRPNTQVMRLTAEGETVIASHQRPVPLEAGDVLKVDLCRFRFGKETASA